MSLCVFAAAREAPDEAALVLGSRVRTWAELADQAAWALGWLEARGLTPGMSEPPVVALEASNTESSLVMLYALISAGIPVLPLHPRLSDVERETQRRLARATLLIDECWRDALPRDVRVSVTTAIDADERLLAVVFTSGTSGSPKGVALSRRAFLASARASAHNLGWHAGDRWLLSLPFAHVGGLSVVTRCLLGRRCVVVAPSSEPGAVCGCLAAHRVTLVSLVPTQLGRWLAQKPPWRPPAGLRAVLLGGAAAAPALIEQATARHVPILLTYGLTETCSQVTTQRYPTTTWARHCGSPLPGVEIVCPDGLIHVRGPMLFSGYVGEGARPVRRPEEWFCTDDHGELDAEGHLYVLGRREELLNTGGENVSAVEVEQALMRSACVAQACVVGIPDETWGQSVGAVVVLTGPAHASAQLLARHVRAELGSFKRPRLWVVVSDLPRTATGKVDRAAVQRLAAGRWRRFPT
ncbi:MAG: AMP-binding protein [Polyangiaceae bacterium]|nr:AMP-binding protein [Polyangiaceae bacterium]